MSETKKNQEPAKSGQGAEPAAEDHEIRAITQWVRAEGPKLGLALAVAVLVAVGIGWMRQQRVRTAEDASIQLEQARTAEEFEDIAAAFPGTASGALALLGAAAEHFDAGRFAEAAEAYDRFLQRYADHPMAAAVRLNRAACDEAMERWAEAQAGYEAVLAEDPPTHVAAQGAMGLGRVMEAQGRHGVARALYEDHLLRLAESEWAAELEDALQRVDRRLRAGDVTEG